MPYLNLVVKGTVANITTNKAYTFAKHRGPGSNTNSVASARKRTIPAERPPHVGEVSANVCG
jgi:hypothetical protein